MLKHRIHVYTNGESYFARIATKSNNIWLTKISTKATVFNYKEEAELEIGLIQNKKSIMMWETMKHISGPFTAEVKHTWW